MQLQWLTLRKFKSKSSDVRFEAVQEMLESGDPRFVDSLIEALRDDSAAIRMVASEALGKIGDNRAIDGLVTALQDDDRAVRASSGRALEALGWKPAGLDGAESPGPETGSAKSRENRSRITSLVAALGHPANGVKAGAALAAIGKPAVDALLDVTEASDAWARHNAIIALGDIGDASATSRLIALLQEGVPGAANTLASIGGPAAIDSLITALDNPRSEVCRPAAEALSLAGDSRVVAPLIEAARKRKYDFDVIARSLGALRDPAATSFLITNLKRSEAVDALVSIGSRAVPALVEKLDSPDTEVRRNAAEALGKIGDPRAISPLRDRIGHGRHCLYALEMLDWEPSNVHEVVMRNLAHGRLEAVLNEGTSAIPAVIDAFDNDDAYIRNAASAVMTRFGSEAVKKLTEALKDDRIQVRARAASTLAAIGDVKCVQPLIAALKAELLLETVEALGKVGGDKAAHALLAVVNDREALTPDRSDARKGKKRPAHAERAAAVRALGLYVQRPEIVDALIEALDDDNSAVREAALGALGDSLDHRAAESLLAMLTAERAFVADPASVQLRVSPSVRMAMDGLARQSEPRAASAFIRIIRSPAFYPVLDAAIANLTYLIERAGPSLAEEDLQSILDLPDSQNYAYDETENGRAATKTATADYSRVKWLASEELTRRQPATRAFAETVIANEFEESSGLSDAAFSPEPAASSGALNKPVAAAAAASGSENSALSASGSGPKENQLILLRCSCGAEANVSAEFAGKKGKCKVCGEPVVVPLREEALA